MSNEKEEFEDWWELFELHCLSSDETIKIIEIVESAWNHQAKKLEEKDKRIKELDRRNRFLLESTREWESWGNMVERKRLLARIKEVENELD